MDYSFSIFIFIVQQMIFCGLDEMSMLDEVVKITLMWKASFSQSANFNLNASFCSVINNSRYCSCSSFFPIF